MLDPFDFKSKMGTSSFNTTQHTKANERDPMEFQNLKIIQNLSPDQKQVVPHLYNPPLSSNNTKQLGRDLLLISEDGGKIRPPKINYSKFVHSSEKQS